MAMEIGDIEAKSGMTQAIYDELATLLEPDLGDLGEDDLEPIRQAWRKIALAVATGVINHLKENMKIKGVETRGDVTTTASGVTGVPSLPAHPNHTHTVELAVAAAEVTFQQVGGTGSVE